MNFKKRIITATATGALVLQSLTPFAFAQTEIVISGNGAGSNNATSVSQSTTTTVSQNNNASVSNNITSNASSGGNDANFNTGGNVTVQTGNAETNTNVSNNLNTNVANVSCCDTGGTTVDISGNGAFSNNNASLSSNSNVSATQFNLANVANNISSNANSGLNSASQNTGGMVTISTGNAAANTAVSTSGNSNVAQIGQAGLPAQNTGVSLQIMNNGAGSGNTIGVSLGKNTSLAQVNTAFVANDISGVANSGQNQSNFNTGGDVTIMTGNAQVAAAVNNALNFNWANIDCGCMYNLTAKIAGNGAVPGFQSTNSNVISAQLGSLQSYFQDNFSLLSNNLGGEAGFSAGSGLNQTSLNTGGVLTDSSIVTGNAMTQTIVSNSGQSNVIGSIPTLPNLPGFQFGFNWAAVLAFLGMS